MDDSSKSRKGEGDIPKPWIAPYRLVLLRDCLLELLLAVAHGLLDEPARGRHERSAIKHTVCFVDPVQRIQKATRPSAHFLRVKMYTPIDQLAFGTKIGRLKLIYQDLNILSKLPSRIVGNLAAFPGLPPFLFDWSEAYLESRSCRLANSRPLPPGSSKRQAH